MKVNPRRKTATTWADYEAGGGFRCLNIIKHWNSDSEAEKRRQVKMDVKGILKKKRLRVGADDNGGEVFVDARLV